MLRGSVRPLPTFGFKHAETAKPAAQPCGDNLKRVVDFSIALVALIVLMPLMLAIAALIKITMGGNVMFAHQRIGFAGRPFFCLKFRSMVENGDLVLKNHLAKNKAAREEWAQTQKLRNDPRISPLGRILRKTSLDELPQLINVLRGDMSCIGPRPITSAELSRYGDRVNDYLKARPGITGFWQVSGRNRLSYRDRVALDSLYVRRWSWKLDLAILYRTIPAVFSRDGAS